MGNSTSVSTRKAIWCKDQSATGSKGIFLGFPHQWLLQSINRNEKEKEMGGVSKQEEKISVCVCVEENLYKSFLLLLTFLTNGLQDTL
jgi:hypothetical protein